MQKLPKFLALSFIAHLMVVSSVRVELPERDAEPQPLEARLQPAELPLAPAPVAPHPERTAPTPKPRSAEKAPPPPVFAAPAFEPGTIVSPEPAANTGDAYAAAPHADPEPTVAASLPVEAPGVEDKPPAIAEPAVPAARRLPRKGEITYEVYLGTQKFSVGHTMQAWELNDDHYRLTSISETTGVVSFFRRERRAYESVGKLTDSGLRPQFFANQRMRSGRSE